MTPNREKEIREWVRLRYGTANKPFYGLDVAGELLAEVDSLRESNACVWEFLRSGWIDLNYNEEDLQSQYAKFLAEKQEQKNARTKDHPNPTGIARSVRGRK